MRKVYRFLDYRQGRKPKGQEDHLLLPCRLVAQGRKPKGQEDHLLLPCRLVARWRSSRSSALLYPPPDNLIVSLFFLEKVGSNTLLKWARFRCEF